MFRKALFVGITVFFVFVLVSAGFVYGTRGAVAGGMARALPWPAALVNGEILSMRLFFDARNAAGVQKRPDVEPMVLRRLIEDVVLRQVARRMGIAPSSEHAAYVQDNVLKFEIIPGFHELFVQSLALRLAMEDAVYMDADMQKPVLRRAQNAWGGLEAGGVFAGKDLGYVSLLQLPESWQEALGQLENDGFTGVLQEPKAFVILQPVDWLGKGEEREVRLFVMRFAKRGLSEVLTEELRRSEVRVFLPGLEFDPDF